eukprot:TRINITY_DN26553_c0_g1_i1.p1 TRINITY_DN26553_c0_g1~~TRINITY_DN26553_c0_g1_i1.p1  ORF type:complete len:173 (+),score=50.95 TRINITY_DN26553_c0_g1_i1:177-695(+)
MTAAGEAMCRLVPINVPKTRGSFINGIDQIDLETIGFLDEQKEDADAPLRAAAKAKAMKDGEIADWQALRQEELKKRNKAQDKKDVPAAKPEKRALPGFLKVKSSEGATTDTREAPPDSKRQKLDESKSPTAGAGDAAAAAGSATAAPAGGGGLGLGAYGSDDSSEGSDADE